MSRAVLLKLQNKLSTEMQRYLIVGVSVYLFEVAVIVVSQALGASALLAVGLAFWLGLIVSFALQKFFTFGDKRKNLSVLSWQFFLVTILVFFNFGFTLLFTNLAQNILPAFACRTIALAITTLWNFALYKTHIFKNSENTIY